MDLVSKLPPVGTLGKHPAVWINSGRRFAHRPCPRNHQLVYIVIFLPGLLPFCCRFLAKPLLIHLRGLHHLFLLEFFIARCLDVRSVHKYHLGFCHSVMQRFVWDMLKDFLA